MITEVGARVRVRGIGELKLNVTRGWASVRTIFSLVLHTRICTNFVHIRPCAHLLDFKSQSWNNVGEENVCAICCRSSSGGGGGSNNGRQDRLWTNIREPANHHFGELNCTRLGSNRGGVLKLSVVWAVGPLEAGFVMRDVCKWPGASLVDLCFRGGIGPMK